MAPWHLAGHLIIAILISWFSYSKTGNIWLIFLSLFLSFAIDLDHLIDYWKAYGFNLNIKRAFVLNYFEKNGKVFVLLHSWELVGLIFLLSRFVTGQYQWFLVTTSLVMFIHILWDSFSYKIYPQYYFLFWRALNNFKIKCANDK